MRPKVKYPAGHQVGMRVPEGGSMCANCEYLGGDRISCKNKNYVAWNGSRFMPAPADQYCCDFYGPANKDQISEQALNTPLDQAFPQ